MAVQAEYSFDLLGLPETSWNRMRNLNGEQRNCIPPLPINVDDAVPDFKMMPVSASDEISNRFLQSHTFHASVHGMATGMPSYAAMPDLNANMWMCNNNNKKRLRESDQPVNFVCLEGLKANALDMPPKSSVSTGLRLSFEEDLSNSTTGRELNNNNNAFFASNNLAAEIQRHKDEMNQFMTLQEARMRQSLIEKTVRHSNALLCAAAAAVSRKVQEKDLQLLQMKQKNMELEERIKGLEVESRAWQNRAKCSEAVATALKLQIDERNKEGSGDSEEEAANAAMANISSISSCQIIGNNNNNNSRKNIYMENREMEMQRKCRVCRSKEVCILLLPCRHLCVCEHCDSKLDVCPLCSTLKTASVQVYIT